MKLWIIWRVMSKPVKYSKSFKTSYQICKRRIPHFSQKFQTALELFFQDRSIVGDHFLVKRSLKGLKAFTVTDDVRVVYQETKNFILLIRVGSHQEVYD